MITTTTCLHSDVIQTHFLCCLALIHPKQIVSKSGHTLFLSLDGNSLKGTLINYINDLYWLHIT